MEKSYTLDTPLLDNYAEFTDPFFDHKALRHAPKPLQLAEGIEKNYKFPTFYQNVNTTVGIYFCNYNRAKAILPHLAMRPVRMPGGRALVIFTTYIYRSVSGVVPYNEIAMLIPVLCKPKLDLPVLPMLLPGLFGSFGYNVFSMPVTSLENQIRGLKIWGLPKVVQQIDIEEINGVCVTKAYEENGDGPYFELRVPTQGISKSFNVTSNLYSVLDGEVKQSVTRFRGEFQVTEYKKKLRQPDLQPDTPSLILGDSPSGKRLKELQIEPHPFQFRYCKNSMSAFDLPNPGYKV